MGDVGQGSTNLYSPFTESGNTITYSAGTVSITGGNIHFPYFQISGTSANFMGAVGFNRNVGTGAILNSSFKAISCIIMMELCIYKLLIQILLQYQVML